MEDIQVHIISDSEEEQDVFCDATVRHAALQGHMKDYRRSLQATASLTSAANNASSPIALEQQQVIHDRGCLARQLYRNGFAEDHELTATRQRYLDATGKAPEVEPAPVKAEGDHHQRQPTEHDIQQLEEELAGNPSLLHQLENGEGSSNPMHLWRLRVFQELQKSQLDLLTHMQQQSLDRCQQQDTSQRRLLRKVVEVIVIPDSEDPEDADTPNTHQQ